jgi:hypothetical protein
LPGQIEDVLLFGLRARGDSKRGRDYDVAVLVRNLLSRPTVRWTTQFFSFTVMAGRVPAIATSTLPRQMAGTGPAMT